VGEGEWGGDLRDRADSIRIGGRVVLGKIYVEIFKWPGDGVFHLAKVPKTVTGAYLLADSKHKALKVTTVGDGVDVKLPSAALDPVATVLVLRTN
jgi:alpha-L-fucosidase